MFSGKVVHLPLKEFSDSNAMQNAENRTVAKTLPLFLQYYAKATNIQIVEINQPLFKIKAGYYLPPALYFTLFLYFFASLLPGIKSFIKFKDLIALLTQNCRSLLAPITTTTIHSHRFILL